MDVNISIPGEKLLCRLLETVEKGIGGLLEPRQIRRVGNAQLEIERRRELMLAQIRKEKELINQGKVVLDPTFRVMLKSENDDTISNGYIERTISSQITRMISREFNINNAIIYAEEELTNDESIPPEDIVNQDWLNQWAEYASLTFEKSLQRLWGKILAGEIKLPGKYSLRTLLFIKHINQKDAEKITRISPLVLGDFIFRDPDNIEKNVPFSVLLDLQELGMIQGVDAMGLVENIDSKQGDKFEESVVLGEKVLTVTSFGHKRKLRLTLPIYRVTPLGREVFSLIDSKVDEKYILEVCEYIRNQGFEVLL